MCFNYFWAHSQQLPQVIDWFGLPKELNSLWSAGMKRILKLARRDKTRSDKYVKLFSEYLLCQIYQ